MFLSAPGLPEADFESDEGVHQGDALASVGFCAAIHEDVKDLDATLAAHGGAARFDMDDGYAVGPRDVVFQAVTEFAAQVEELGLRLQWAKSECFSFAGGLESCPERPADMPLGAIRGENGAVIGLGLKIGGVPVGDACYVAAFLQHRSLVAVSRIDKVQAKLRNTRLSALWTTLHYALLPLFQDWTQHCYPEDCMPAAAMVVRRAKSSNFIADGRQQWPVKELVKQAVIEKMP